MTVPGTPSDDRARFRRTLVRVLSMQVITLLLLGVLQAFFTP
jgi:hypothetical protein